MPTQALPDVPFAASDVVSLGISRQILRQLVASGRVRRLTRGVYADANLAVTPQLIASALSLVVSADQVVTDRSAAAIHGIDCYTYGETQAPPLLEVCALRGSAATKRQHARGGTRSLEPTDVTEVGGVRVTTTLRTALDLGCHLRRRDAMAALNGFARLHGVTSAELARELPRFAGRRGVVQLRSLIPYVDARIESPRESWVWLEILSNDLPRPVPQHWVGIDGAPTYRLDFAYPQARVAVEYDGEEFHTSDEQRGADQARRAWLRRNGWTVIVVRKGDFTGRRLERWLEGIRQALRDVPSTRRW